MLRLGGLALGPYPIGRPPFNQPITRLPCWSFFFVGWAGVTASCDRGRSTSRPSPGLTIRTNSDSCGTTHWQSPPVFYRAEVGSPPSAIVADDAGGGRVVTQLFYGGRPVRRVT